jgi:hypothetical protein
VSFESTSNALRDIHWGSAADWSPGALEWLKEYYRRLQPYWPATRKRIEPVDRAMTAAVMSSLAASEQELIRVVSDSIIEAALARHERMESTTRRLLPLVLAWALAVDAGRLAADADPGAPLVALFTAGFQLNYTDAGIEVHYKGGWMIAPVPTREQLSGK